MVTIIERIFKKGNRTIGVIGSKNTAKSSLILSEITKLKKEHDKLKVYAYGVSPNLYKVLEKNGISIIYNSDDILNKKDSVIFIDEVNQLFSSKTRDKQLKKMNKFFNRIYHLNNYVILTTAENGYWNKVMNGLVNAWIIKSVDFDELVNGTRIKSIVKNLARFSTNKLELKINEFFAIFNGETKLNTFPYIVDLDSKKFNKSLF